MQLLAETGPDLTRWPSEKHFTSWLGLSPGQHSSGKMRRNARKKGKPKAGQIFRIIAQGLINSKDVASGSCGDEAELTVGGGAKAGYTTKARVDKP